MLGRKHFQETFGFESGTFKTDSGKTTRGNQKILVVDTPGLLDNRSDITPYDTVNEILKSINITSPGIHSIILVIGLDRFTEENATVFQMLMQIFGDGISKYLIVVFTRKDQLERSNKTLDEVIKKSPAALKNIINYCRSYMVIDNTKSPEKNKDATLLIKEINDIVRSNGGQYYTSECYQIAEEFFKDEVKRQQNDGSLKKRLDAQQKRESYSRPLPKLYEEPYSFNMVTYTSCHAESSEAYYSGYNQQPNQLCSPIDQAGNDYCCVGISNDQAHLMDAARGSKTGDTHKRMMESNFVNEYTASQKEMFSRHSMPPANRNKVGDTQKRMTDSNFAKEYTADQEKMFARFKTGRNQAAADNKDLEAATPAANEKQGEVEHNGNIQQPGINEDNLYDEALRDEHRRRILENEDNINQGFWNRMMGRIKSIIDAFKKLFGRN